MESQQQQEQQSEQQQTQQQQQNQQQQQQQQQKQQNQQQNQQPPYTIPGILHYLQYEWHRFEVERQEWEVEKAEMSARIALLQGEKKSHENLKHDLVRRIKMLEYCLRMERAKYHKLKHGTDPPIQGEELQKSQNNEDSFMNNSNNNSSTVTYGRELLRHYLQEIGYTDTIIDLRSNRVRSLLGIVDNNSQTSNQQQQQQASTSPNNDITDSKVTSITSATTNASTTPLTSAPSAPPQTVTSTINRFIVDTKKSPLATSDILNKNATPTTHSTKTGDGVDETEASVLATFGFLYDHEGMKDSNQMDEDEEEEISEDVVDAADRAASTSSNYSYVVNMQGCNETPAMIRQKLNLLNNGKPQSNTNTNANSSIESQKDIDSKTFNDHLQTDTVTGANSKNSWCPSPQKGDVVDIGELATLTTLGSENAADDYKKKQWTAKYRLQSHYDCVRALQFSETDSLLVTASEDETIKLWHLSRPSPNSGKSRQANLPPSINAQMISTLEGSTLDLEPLHTYRGHTSRILCITLYKNNIFSGAQNGEIIMWNMIKNPSTADQYDKFDSSSLELKYEGHEDAVWALETVMLPDRERPNLISAGADKCIKIWATSGDGHHIGTIELTSSPTCIVKIPPYNVCYTEPADIAVSFDDGKIRLYDLASCIENQPAIGASNQTQPTAIFESDSSHRINSIVIHPTARYMASADSNHDIKFWDLKTRECKKTMVAHLDEVTSLACDPSGKYLLSASHDCSVRLWLFEDPSCIQEITSHRKKFDEGIFAVAFHPSLSHFATAGADGLAKVFV